MAKDGAQLPPTLVDTLKKPPRIGVSTTEHGNANKRKTQFKRAHTFVDDNLTRESFQDTIGSKKMPSHYEVQEARQSMQEVVSIEDSQVQRFRENIDLVGEDSNDDTRE